MNTSWHIFLCVCASCIAPAAVLSIWVFNFIIVSFMIIFSLVGCSSQEWKDKLSI